MGWSYFSPSRDSSNDARCRVLKTRLQRKFILCYEAGNMERNPIEINVKDAK